LRLNDWGVEFQKSALIQELANCRHHEGDFRVAILSFRIEDDVEVTLPQNLFPVLQPKPLIGKRSHGFR